MPPQPRLHCRVSAERKLEEVTFGSQPDSPVNTVCLFPLNLFTLADTTKALSYSTSKNQRTCADIPISRGSTAHSCGMDRMSTIYTRSSRGRRRHFTQICSSHHSSSSITSSGEIHRGKLKSSISCCGGDRRLVLRITENPAGGPLRGRGLSSVSRT